MRLLLALVLLALPAQAAEPLKPDVMCDAQSGWCAIKKDTLKALLENTQKLAAHTAELRVLCGWDKPR